MPEFTPTERTRIKRLPDRAVHDTETGYAILDEALTCHLAFLRDGGPVLLPTIHTRMGDHLYFHGSRANYMLRAAVDADICCSVMILDGIVLARATAHHSMNYRSVVAFGRGRAVEDAQEKRRVLDTLMEHVVPGRAADCPTTPDVEIRKTLVVAMPLDEISVKIRTGPPSFDPQEDDPSVWGGVLPLSLVPGTAWADEHVPAGQAIPAYLTGLPEPYRAKRNGSGERS